MKSNHASKHMEGFNLKTGWSPKWFRRSWIIQRSWKCTWPQPPEHIYLTFIPKPAPLFMLAFSFNAGAELCRCLSEAGGERKCSEKISVLLQCPQHALLNFPWEFSPWCSTQNGNFSFLELLLAAWLEGEEGCFVTEAFWAALC